MEQKRLTLDIPLELHQKIKARCALRNITMVKWILRVLLKAIKEEEMYE